MRPKPHMRIAVICERFSNGYMTPCAYIRLFLPLSRVSQQIDISVQFVSSEEIPVLQADIFIWHRFALLYCSEIDALRKRATQIQAKLVYDIDDDILAMNIDHNEAEDHSEKKQIILHSLASADVVWVSTRELASRYKNMCKKLDLVSNELDPRLWKPRARAEQAETVQLFYMGTRTHQSDFNHLIAPAFKEIKAKYKNKVSLSVAGVFDPSEVGPDMPWEVLSPPPTAFLYPVFSSWIQTLDTYCCGLAPLIDTPFNRAKSNIKWLEYSFLGMATIASNLPPYREATELGHNILLTTPTVEGFKEAFDIILRDQTRRSKLQESAEAVAAKKYADWVTNSGYQQALSRVMCAKEIND